jgi:hypothetical protein
MQTRFVIQGEGLEFAHTGRIVYDSASLTAIFEAGQHDSDDQFREALCSALD